MKSIDYRRLQPSEDEVQEVGCVGWSTYPIWDVYHEKAAKGWLHLASWQEVESVNHVDKKNFSPAANIGYQSALAYQRTLGLEILSPLRG